MYGTCLAFACESNSTVTIPHPSPSTVPVRSLPNGRHNVSLLFNIPNIEARARLEGDTFSTDATLNWTNLALTVGLNAVNDDGNVADPQPNPFSIFSTGNMNTYQLIVNSSNLPVKFRPSEPQNFQWPATHHHFPFFQERSIPG